MLGHVFDDQPFAGQGRLHLRILIALQQIAARIELELHLPRQLGLVEEIGELPQLLLRLLEVHRPIDMMFGERFAVAVDRRKSAGQADDEVSQIRHRPPAAQAGSFESQMNRLGRNRLPLARTAQIAEVQRLFEHGFIGREHQIQILLQISAIDFHTRRQSEHVRQLRSDRRNLHVDIGSHLTIRARLFVLEQIFQRSQRRIDGQRNRIFVESDDNRPGSGRIAGFDASSHPIKDAGRNVDREFFGDERVAPKGRAADSQIIDRRTPLDADVVHALHRQADFSVADPLETAQQRRRNKRQAHGQRQVLNLQVFAGVDVLIVKLELLKRLDLPLGRQFSARSIGRPHLHVDLIRQRRVDVGHLQLGLAWIQINRLPIPILILLLKRSTEVDVKIAL